jgi:hypothetical protein
MHDTALTEIKALLTLALLKSGTSSKDIQNAIDIAATTRLMAGEESTESEHDDRGIDNVTNIRDLRHGNAVEPRERKQPVSGLNGDVKALLSLLLLQHGATSREIITTLRVAAATPVQEDRHDSEEAEFEQPEIVAARILGKGPVARKPEARAAETLLTTPKQGLRNERLAPIDRSTRAA